MPYGSGSRGCLGMPQANVTMLATLAVMLTRFSFNLADKVTPQKLSLPNSGHMLDCSECHRVLHQYRCACS